MMVITRVWLPLPAPLVAVNMTLNTPGVVAMPEIKPVAALIASPGGRPVAE